MWAVLGRTGMGRLRAIRTLLVQGVLLAGASALGETVYLTQSFRGTTASDWTFVTGQGDGPSLTAATGVDTDGSGWLRLTNDATDQASFVYHNQPISTAHGLIITFDFVTWGSSSSLADGFTLALFDSGVTPSAGGYGGSLGYAQRSGVDGLNGAVVGFGFDEFGNFSNPTEGRVGGPGRTQNSIAIRGSMGASRSEGYAYITGTSSLTAFSSPSQSSRPSGSAIHTVRITIPTTKIVTVEWKAGDGPWETLIGPYACSLTCPETVKIGFTAGTGASRAYHEIRDLTVAAVPEPASLFLLLLSCCFACIGRSTQRASARQQG